MTIFYKFDGQMYINITNGCPCDCVFCLRNNSDSVKDNGSLWLEHEPTRQEALDNLLARDFSQYRELVFCGFGEPMYRTDDIVWLVDELKKRVPNLPPVRINTNGHANLILGRDVCRNHKSNYGRQRDRCETSCSLSECWCRTLYCRQSSFH